ncbi:MAG: response regulator [Microbacteriaceae bacterium]
MSTIRVLVADDEALIRQALRLFIGNDPRTEVIAEASNGAEAVQASCALVPDVVLMDMQMPVLDGVEAIRQIAAKQPHVSTLAVTTFSSRRLVVSALEAGAAGYLVKDTAPESIAQAIVDVHEGRQAMSPQVTRELVRNASYAGIGGDWTRPPELTHREHSIVQLLAEGKSNAEIAAALHLSEATVKGNFGRILAKWGVRDRVQVLILAAKSGIVALD